LYNLSYNNNNKNYKIMLIEDSIVMKEKHIILWFIMNQCGVGPIETVGYVQSSVFSFNRASMG
jgi:hypothetical protein